MPDRLAIKSDESFKHFLFRNKSNRLALIVAGILIVMQFIVFKILYPFANFMPDSYGYIEAAWNNYPISVWPIGYSKFIRIFSAFAKSDIALVLFQYTFLQASILLFVFTLLYHLRPGKIVKYILLGFFILNPMLLAMANYVSADAMFTAISIFWFTQLLWILYRPQAFMIWLHAALLLLAFMFRFNALYYPLISLAVMTISKLRLPLKLSGIGLSLLVISLFSWHSGNQYKALTGHRQFSAFGGWQLACNAIFAYSRQPRDNEVAPQQFLMLHNMVRRHLDSLDKLKSRPDSVDGIYYLWSGPLMQYFVQHYSNGSYLKRYASAALLYQDYGKYLIKQYPNSFARYFLLYNAMRYYTPPSEFLGEYIADSINPIAVNWFGYKSNRLNSYSNELKAAKIYSVLFTTANILGFGALLCSLMLGIKKIGTKPFRAFIALAFFTCLANAFFSIVAAPVVLRYQVLELLLILPVGVFLLEKIISLAIYDEKKILPQENEYHKTGAYKPV